MVSWWGPYLARGPRPDFNNGPRDNSNCGRTLGPQHLFESDLNNALSPGHSALGLDESTSIQVSHLWSPGGCNILGLRPDFNNDPADNSDSGCIFAPSVYSGPTQIMTPPQANPILFRWKILLFRCHTNGLLLDTLPGQGPKA